MADSGLRVTFHEGVALNPAARQELEATTRLCQTTFGDFGGPTALPLATDLIITTDFEQAVRGELNEAKGLPDEAPFEADRPGGSRVAAKTMPKDPAYDNVVIVMDATGWPEELTGPVRAHIVSLIGHEVAHTVLERIALGSQVTKNVPYPSYTPGEIARSLSRIINHEYRADRLAEAIVSAVFSTDRDGAPVPLHTWDLAAESYRKMLRDTFFEIYAEGPGAVQDYRCHNIPLDVMFHKVVGLTKSMLINFIHARAIADAAGDIPLLSDAEIGQLPFVRLYLKDTVPPLLDAIGNGPLLMPPAEWVTLDAGVVAAGEVTIREIWRRLGLTFDEPAGTRSFTIHVAAPLVA